MGEIERAFDRAEAEIERLREENQRLKQALVQIADIEQSAYAVDDILVVVKIAIEALK